METTPDTPPTPAPDDPADGAPAVLGYARVSSLGQASSGLGIDAQQTAIDAWAAVGGHRVAHHSENGLSGSVEPRRRPVLGALLDRLADPADPAAVLVVAKMDRLGRSVIDVLGLCETAERQGWSLVMLDPAIDATTAAGRAMLGMMAVMAQFERDMAAERTREALAAKRQRDPQWRAGPGQIDPATIARIGILRQSGKTWQAIADALNADNTPTATGKGRWTITQARRYWNEYARA